MTMKKIVLSALAATMVTSIAFAGTITATNGGKISQELLSFQDVNVTNAPNGAKYVPTNIPATSLKNPIFKFTFANMKDFSADSNVSIYEFVDGNETNCSAGNTRRVAGDPQISGTSSNILSFNAVSSDIYVYNGRAYQIIEDDDNNITGTCTAGLTAPSVKGQVAKGSTASATITAELYSGDSQARNDYTSAVTLYTISKEWAATVKTPLDALINAADNFLTFTTANSSTTADLLTVNVTRDTMIPDGSFTPTSIPWIVTFDQNLTANSVSTSAQGLSSHTDNDMNTTAAISVIAAGSNVDANLTYDTTGNTVAINKTIFDTKVTMTDGTHPFTLITSATGNAGKWDIYGYNAQIPNVSTNGSTIDTVTTVTNRSGLDAKVIFTLIDADGTAVVLNSDDYTEINAIAKNTTEKYTASVLKTLAMAKNAAFTGDAFALEISVPTTPSSVYATSSFKNMSGATPVFKDLPVYNTSEMTY